MSPARRRFGSSRGLPGSPASRREAHLEWLRLIEISGPFLSVPVLTAEWPDLEPLDLAARDRLRRAHADWQATGDRAPWIDFVLEDLLGWHGLVRRDDMAALALEVAEHEAVITPSFTLTDPASGEIRLLGMVTDDSPVARVRGSDWPATPADRLAQLCRARGVELGLATDGRWWALVWSPAGGVTTVAVFDSISWSDSSERMVVRAFISLLERRRWFAVPEDHRLPALLRESLKHQEDITEALGVQVRQAVEMLVAAFSRSDGVPADVSATEVYRGAVTVMMRLVFLLFAEESGLLPADNALYASSYSAGGLYAELEARVADARGNEAELDHTYLAWHRLLALFTVVYQGVSHPELRLVGHDGSLFDPVRYLWFPLMVDDRTVLHMLRSVQTVTIAGELRTVSFRTLTVEQIGYVYEGLLSFEGFRAADVVVGLIGKQGREEEVTLASLEALGSDDLPAKLAEKYKDSGIGSVRALGLKLAPLSADDRAQAEARLYAVAKDHGLVQRLLPYFGIIRRDLRGDAVVILPGQLYVTESALRASTGTHYTPRFLAEQVAEGALEPLVYNPGPLQTADRSTWRLRTADEILSLRVADIAMGSGAFLVAACRYLAGKLIEAWSLRGNVDAERALAASPIESGLDLDVAADPLVIKARRDIIEHCLYGVDINEMAVEMAKLSLWLVSMDPGRPFTFLDDKLAVGDSLLGITSVEQLEWMHLNPAEGRKLHEDTLMDFMAGIRGVLADVSEQRRLLVDIPDDIDGIAKKREILGDVGSKTKDLTLYADLLVGAALVTKRWLGAAKLAHDAAVDGAVVEADQKAKEWLATDQPDGAFDRRPLHWPLVFPEVFDPAMPGFDAIIGNPPFLGGQKLTGSLGVAYREYLIERIGGGVRGSADLVAYFLLRVDDLLNVGGQTGLIATNTLAQGDTREVGLDQVVAAGTEIRQAVKSEPWPSKSAVLRYAAVWMSRQTIDSDAERVADGTPTGQITTTLDPGSRVTGQPYRLSANQGISFVGSYVLGMGFTMERDRAQGMIARDARNKDVLFPYLNGQDLNSNSNLSGNRWVIDFHDWPLEKAETYVEPYRQVLHDVKPERLSVTFSKNARDRWWQFERRRPELYSAISGLGRVIAMTRVSKVVMPVLLEVGPVFTIDLAVYASDDTAMLALLSSAPHYWWAISRASTMKGDLRYTVSDVFETLPISEITSEMREHGDRLDTFRRNLMLARQVGLTATYNLVHDPKCADADIAELRETHRAIDAAVVQAYGWNDLADSLGHEFYETRQGTRYTIAPAPRQEILDRLLELNHARYAEEVKVGLRAKKPASKRPSKKIEGQQTLLDM
jgi:hypothetical protein